MYFRIVRNLIFACLVAYGLGACSEENTSGQASWYESHTLYNYNPNKGNLWQSMRGQLKLASYSNVPRVHQQIVWFEHHQAYLNRVIAESAPYIYFIYQQTKVHHLPADLALIPVIESQYNPYARSRVGAEGLWQMMPKTASGFGLKRDWWYNGSQDVVASTNAALDYFSYLHSFFNGDWLLAIAGYDAGEGTVLNAVRYNKYHHRPTDFWDLPVPNETRDYVPRLLAVSAIIKQPWRYGIHLAPVNDTAYIEQVNVGSQMALSKAAQLSNVPLNTLKVLNPALKRDETDPHGPYTIVMPKDGAETFRQRIADLANQERLAWDKHIVHSKETLEKIAAKYSTTAAMLRQVNDLHSNTVQANQTLLIPPPDSVLVADSTPAKTATTASNTAAASTDNNSDTAKVIDSAAGITYKVKHGDDLRKIAENFNTSISKIRTANHLTSNLLKIGQVLIIPSKNIEPKLATTSTAKNPATKTYTVRKGDYLDKIADNFNTSAKNIIKWNKLSNDSELQPGQKLIIHD